MNHSEIKCPVCKNDSFLTPNLQLYTSPCFHKICKQCLNELFSVGYAPCPQCGTQLRKVNFISNNFEDIMVEHEINIRKQLLRIYKKQENPKDIVRYNDWLECFENIVEEMLVLKDEGEIHQFILNLKNDKNNFINTYIDEIEERNDALKTNKKPREQIKTEEQKTVVQKEVIKIPRLKKDHPIPSCIFRYTEYSDLTPELTIKMCMGAKNNLFNSIM
ncbi:TFB3 [Ecytonucleospora hepatopenaei]|uniref:TFB3 n=1 Tax=Ecytonucleospora hepatopenaei TaxID=646526 RepID=A0A1W0E6J6_9MICR|nr:TFB3 [Ecytonucleospora hepatopenaei]